MMSATNIKNRELNPLISLAKVLAMFLIINSHSDSLFPSKLSFLATGGALGNELFFLVGGYLFSVKGSFVNQTIKRFVRLYIPTYIMTVFLYAIGDLHLSDINAKVLFERLVWPTSFWFVSAIFAFGIIYHIFYKIGVFDTNRRKICFYIVGVVINLLIYFFCVTPKSDWIVEDYKLLNNSVYYKCIYSFFVFCIGCDLKNITIRTKKNKSWLFVGAATSFIAFNAYKIILHKNYLPMNMQIVSQLLTVACVVCIYLFITNSNFLSSLMSNRIVARITNELGSITLEAFLVQFHIISLISKSSIFFPLNYILATFLIIVVSSIFKRLNDGITNCILKPKKN